MIFDPQAWAAATGLLRNASPEHDEMVSRSRRRLKTALVVNDGRFARMMMVDALESCGYVVLEAADGPSGLSVLESTVQIDLLVINHRLPDGVAGRDLADTARRERPFLKTLLISDLSSAEDTAGQPPI